MTRRTHLRPLMAPLLLALALSAHATHDTGPPTSGAPYVPSPHSIVTRMLELAGVSGDDYVIDLGSGDGRIVLTAAKVFGARGLGVELRQDLVERSREAAQRQGVADLVRFEQQDLFATDISDATLVTVYLLPETLTRLRGKLLRELAPGTAVLSHDYPLDNWNAEQFVQLEHPEKVEVTGTPRTNLYLYRVPADVAGRWHAEVPAAVSQERLALDLTQTVTSGAGTATDGDRTIQLQDVEIVGRRLSFRLPDRAVSFMAEVVGDGLEGEVRVDGRSLPWRATRR